MQKILILLAIVMLATSFASARDLVTDPVDPSTCGGENQPNCPVTFCILEDDILITEQIPVEPDMSIRFNIDNRPPGQHVYEAIYYDSEGGQSDRSNPYIDGPDAPRSLRVNQ